jgi:hypothetical protein
MMSMSSPKVRPSCRLAEHWMLFVILVNLRNTPECSVW